MPLEPLRVTIQIEDILCRDEGDGWGSAEPYLWTIFFKIDGTTAVLNDDLTLSGSALVVTTPGSHGNLPNSDVDEGETIPVPSAIGEWNVTLHPIKSPPSLEPLTPSVSGLIGVLCVLMEEDNVSDAGAEAGHRALNNSVESALNDLVNGYNVFSSSFGDEEMAQLIEDAKNAVKDAIKSEQSFWENVWSWFNADDVIGTALFTFQHTQLRDYPFLAFYEEWRSEGHWELRGHVSSAPACPAELAQSVAASLDRTYDLQSLREFRKQFPRSLQPWLDLVARNNPEFARQILGNRKLQEATADLLEAAIEAVKDIRRPIGAEHLRNAELILTEVAKNGGHRARIDAERLLSVIPQLSGKSPSEILAALTKIAPGRHPRTVDGRRLSKNTLRADGSLRQYQKPSENRKGE